MGIKIIGQIAFWDTAENLMRISQKADLRANFAASVMDVAEQLQLDGILFQWMWPGCPGVLLAIFATVLRATQQTFDSKLESIALSITTHTNFFHIFKDSPHFESCMIDIYTVCKISKKSSCF